MPDQTGTPPAGWYNDPTNANQQRWWDGVQWSTSTRPLADRPPPDLPPPSTPPLTPQSNPLAATAPGGSAGPPEHGMGDQGAGGGGTSGTRTLMVVLGIAVLLLLGGCVAILGARSSSDAGQTANEVAAEASEDDREAVVEPTTADVVEPTTPDDAEPTTPDDAEPEPDEPSAEGTDEPEPPADDGEQVLGTRQDPLPMDQPIDLTWRSLGDADGSVWTTIIGPTRDITDEVLAENQFNDPPPDGVRFVGFEVELTLVEAGKEPLAPSFNLTWEILGGATARVYTSTTIETESFGCGVTPGDFDDFAEVFAGGTLSGTVCIPLPTEDLTHPDSRVAMRFASGDRAIFGP